MKYKPNIVAFFCNWCTYTAADLAGIGRKIYSPHVRIIRVMCSGRVDPELILEAFAQGADGVLIGGCHPGDCHYQNGNHKTWRRVHLLRKILEENGIEPDRLRLEWISASEGDKLQKVCDEFTEVISQLGPIHKETIHVG